jgi:hypothetical protein
MAAVEDADMGQILKEAQKQLRTTERLEAEK